MADVKVLLDSNICIYLLEGLSDAARDRLETFAHGEVAVSAVSYAEIMKGLVRSEPEAREKADALFLVDGRVAFRSSRRRDLCFAAFQAAQL